MSRRERLTLPLPRRLSDGTLQPVFEPHIQPADLVAHFCPATTVSNPPAKTPATAAEGCKAQILLDGETR